MTPFKVALSQQLARDYIPYFNSLNLRHPRTGALLTLGEDGRSGSGYEYLMERQGESAGKFLRRAEQGLGPCSPQDYLTGHYTRQVPAQEKPRDPELHHGGPQLDAAEDAPPMSLEERVLRPPEGTPAQVFQVPMIQVPGTPKEDWLFWDGERAVISHLDTYLLRHRRRMKPCTAFDKLDNDSGENQVLGTADKDYRHFDRHLYHALCRLQNQFPEECGKYLPAFQEDLEEPGLAERLRLIDPFQFIGTGEKSRQARHFRIRVGSCDGDTSFTMSMILALKLQNAGCDSVDYALVWDKPHCDADYPGEAADWMEAVCREN